MTQVTESINEQLEELQLLAESLCNQPLTTKQSKDPSYMCKRYRELKEDVFDPLLKLEDLAGKLVLSDPNKTIKTIKTMYNTSDKGTVVKERSEELLKEINKRNAQQNLAKQSYN